MPANDLDVASRRCPAECDISARILFNPFEPTKNTKITKHNTQSPAVFVYFVCFVGNSRLVSAGANPGRFESFADGPDGV